MSNVFLRWKWSDMRIHFLIFIFLLLICFLWLSLIRIFYFFKLDWGNLMLQWLNGYNVISCLIWFEALFQFSKLKILFNMIFSPPNLLYFRHLLDVLFCRICFYLQRATHENLIINWKNHPSYFIYWKTRSPQKIFLTRFC